MKGLSVHRSAVAGRSREAALVGRIRRVIDRVDLDCGCRSRLDEALARFAALEHRRVARQHLVRARQHRERIKAILDFLQEVDELLASEPDRSVYTELALLFEEASAIAAEGAASLHRLAALHNEGEGQEA